MHRRAQLVNQLRSHPLTCHYGALAMSPSERAIVPANDEKAAEDRFEHRATLVQRLFTSSSNFGLVCCELLADGSQCDLYER